MAQARAYYKEEIHNNIASSSCNSNSNSNNMLVVCSDEDDESSHDEEQDFVHIEDLPKDILFYIFLFLLGGRNKHLVLSSIGLVCKRWASVMHDERFWRQACLTFGVKVKRPLGSLPSSATSTPTMLKNFSFGSIPPPQQQSQLQVDSPRTPVSPAALSSVSNSDSEDSVQLEEEDIYDESSFYKNFHRNGSLYKTAFFEQRFHKCWATEKVVDFLNSRVYNLRNHEVGYTKLYYCYPYVVLGFLKEFQFYYYPKFDVSVDHQEMFYRNLSQYTKPKRRRNSLVVGSPIIARMAAAAASGFGIGGGTSSASQDNSSSSSSSSSSPSSSQADNGPVPLQYYDELLMNHLCTFQCEDEVIKLDVDYSERGTNIVALTETKLELFTLSDEVHNHKYQYQKSNGEHLDPNANAGDPRIMPERCNAGFIQFEHGYTCEDVALVHTCNGKVYALMKRASDTDVVAGSHIRIWDFKTRKLIAKVPLCPNKIVFTSGAWNARELFDFKGSTDCGALVDENDNKILVLDHHSNEWITIDSTKGTPSFVRTMGSNVLFWGADAFRNRQKTTAFLELWRIKRENPNHNNHDSRHHHGHHHHGHHHHHHHRHGHHHHHQHQHHNHSHKEKQPSTGTGTTTSTTITKELILDAQYEHIIAAHMDENRVYVLCKPMHKCVIYLDIWDSNDGTFVCRVKTFEDTDNFFDKRDFDKRYIRIMKSDERTLFYYVIQYKPGIGSILSVRQVATLPKQSLPRSSLSREEEHKLMASSRRRGSIVDFVFPQPNKETRSRSFSFQMRDDNDRRLSVISTESLGD